MSIKSQEANMRKLAGLLSPDLSYIWGERESGPNGDKRAFLKQGRNFLWVLAKDLKLHDVKINTNPGGIAVSGECSVTGMWENQGIYIQLSQPTYDRERVLIYRTIQHSRDCTGGQNHFLTQSDLKLRSYYWLLEQLSALRKGRASYGWAA